MSKTTNYILELESSGEVYFKRTKNNMSLQIEDGIPMPNKIYGQEKLPEIQLGEAGSGSVSIHPLARTRRASEEKTFCSEAGLLQTGEELSKVFQGGAGN